MKHPLETASLICAFFAAAVGLFSLGVFVLSMFGRLFSSNWSGFGFEELLYALGAVIYYPLLLVALSLVLAGLQAWVGLRNDE